ncbi:hypothetical protein [Reyranella sp.]|uniref:bestrophin-like domain n=1 Tax=Reyranella sp. TaxID=1929291 RepID=UPI003BA8DF5C
MVPELIQAALLLAGAMVASEIGFQLGRLSGPRDEAFSKQLSVISGATFALVAFLIGFGFSGAATRYVDRLDLVVKEANALGTAYLRADVLPQPARGELQSALRDYARGRVALLKTETREEAQPLLQAVGPEQQRMWEIALRGSGGNAQIMRLVLPPLNEVIDLHTTHLASARRHIPTAIMVALLISAALSLALASFANGQAGRRFPVLNFVYGFALATALWMTIDLDHPRRGLIQETIQPLIETLQSMKS